MDMRPGIRTFHKRPPFANNLHRRTNGKRDPRFARLTNLLHQANIRTRFDFRDSLSRNIFDDLRPVWDVVGYPRTIDTASHYGKWRRGGLASKILNFFPDLTWDNDIQIRQDEEATELSPWDEKVISLWDEFNIWDVLKRADILSGMGKDGWSIIFIGADDTDQMMQPLKRGNLLYLHPHGQLSATVEKWNDVKTDPRYGMPEFYSITSSESVLSVPKIHWSRVIHVVNDPLDSNVIGRPTLEPSWNDLINLEKISAGGAEGTWRNADPIKHFNTKSDLGTGSTSTGEPVYDDEFELVRDEIDEVIHYLETAILTHDMESKTLAGEVPEIKDNIDAIVSLIAGTHSIPKGELLGSQAGALASSEEDAKRLRNRTRERQQEKAVPLASAIVDKFMSMGVLDEVDDYTVVLPPTDERTDAERAEIVKTYADANKAQSESGGGPIILSDEIRRQVLNMEPIEESDLPDNSNDDDSDTDREARQAQIDGRDYGVVDSVAVDFTEMLASEISNIFVSASRAFTGIDTAEQRASEAIEEELSTRMPEVFLEILGSAGSESYSLVKDRGSYFRSAIHKEIRHKIYLRRLSPIQYSIPLDFEKDINARYAGEILSLVYNPESPANVAISSQRSAELITEILPDTREAIRQNIILSQQRDISQGELTRRIRQAVGLRTDQVEALHGFMDRIAVANPGDRVFMGIRNGEKVYVTVPRSGVTRSWEIKQYNRYANQLRDYRANLIAQRESRYLANVGQRDMWVQARQAGDLGSNVKRSWIHNTTRHIDRAGVNVGIDEPWPWGTEPGEEPGCQCGQELVA